MKSTLLAIAAIAGVGAAASRSGFRFRGSRSEADPDDCLYDTSLFWISPEGEEYRMGGGTHEQWAAERVGPQWTDPEGHTWWVGHYDFEETGNEIDASTVLLRTGWIRVLSWSLFEAWQPTQEARERAVELSVYCFLQDPFDPEKVTVDIYSDPKTVRGVALPDLAARWGAPGLVDRLYEGLTR